MISGMKRTRNKKPISITIDKNLIPILEQMATDQDRKLSWLINEAIKNFLGRVPNEKAHVQIDIQP
jgi:predicted transcriptional regulator